MNRQAGNPTQLTRYTWAPIEAADLIAFDNDYHDRSQSTLVAEEPSGYTWYHLDQVIFDDLGVAVSRSRYGASSVRRYSPDHTIYVWVPEHVARTMAAIDLDAKLGYGT
jgi:hypothetical protein